MQQTNKRLLHLSLIPPEQVSGVDLRGVNLMYLKKVDGPRSVRLPDGTVMTRADLPEPTTRRWVASRKAAVVRGVQFGLISEEDALQRYGLSEEEFQSWCAAVSQYGEGALKTTSIQKYRQL